MKTVYFTAAQLAARGSGDIPRELVSSSHLIYSSPAALAFNSPGAEGYGVKRAGLAVPESVMLIVSPGCCGRNTSAISRMPGYEERFFYLTMDETDLVTGRHLKKIPDAVEEICRCLAETGRRPRAVMICITCVDALLGTDMERVCRRAQEKVPGVRVRPCYMYALTREGRKPPMVHVRQSIYELLEPRKKKASSVNLMGFFAPLSPESELPAVLSQAGVRTVRQIGACADYDAFQEMAEANFNLVLNPEARPAAYDLQKRLGIPFIELTRFYQIDRIEAQYAALGRVLQTSFAEEEWKNEAVRAVASFRRDYPDAVFSVGEGMNGNPFELACALVREGFAVREIFGTVSEDSFVWLRLLAALSPGTRVYSNLHPTMLHFGEPDAGSDDALLPVTISIGRDAGWYHPEAPNVQWITDIQPFGYGAVTGLFHALHDAMRARSRGSYSPEITLGKPAAASENPADSSGKPAGSVEKPADFSGRAAAASGKPVDSSGRAAAASEKPADSFGKPAGSVEKPADSFGKAAASVENPADSFGKAAASVEKPADYLCGKKKIRGFRRFTTPFAPDQSGAVSVLYDMGGISVVCDAGGCTGNICGFDEPRWFERRSAVFSAGLRDMDAILGRDDRLVEKLAEAAGQIPAQFAAIIGTPVPAVIGTDYRALRRLAEKKTCLPVLGIDTDGMEYYDRGIEKTYLALLNTFCKKKEASRKEVSRKDVSHKEASPKEASRKEVSRKEASRKEVSRKEAFPKEASQKEVSRKEASRTGSAVCPDRLSRPDRQNGKRIIGVWGFTPLDFSGILSTDELRAALRTQGYDVILCPGAGTDIGVLADDIANAEKNVVVSPAGTAAAMWLEKEFGTPWEYGIPGGEALSEALLRNLREQPGGENLPGTITGNLRKKPVADNLSEAVNPAEAISKESREQPGGENLSKEDFRGKTGEDGTARDSGGCGVRKVLIVHQQVLADRIRRDLEKAGFFAATAGFFMMQKDLFFEEDSTMREEADLRALVQEEGYDCVIADRSLAPVLAGLPVRLIHLPHFAVSGEH